MKEIKVPGHIAFIMDGNGRWATQRKKPRAYGHRMGLQNMLDVCDHAFRLGVRIITVFALSAENMKRPEEELNELYDIFRSFFEKKKSRIKSADVRIRAIGDISVLPQDLQDSIIGMEQETADRKGALLNVCLNYGGRQDILQAVNEAVARGRFVDDTSFHALLQTAGIPDPDLIIRTGREVRISNFLLYQAAYAEFYFSEKMWPAFKKRDLERALISYAERERRFGNIRSL